MRQYIGARYVPKFADPILHDSTRSYEALEIVQNATGDSFTSKKPVPVGVALTDTTYWVSSGNFNSQLAEVAGDLAALTDVVDKIPTKRNIILIGDSYVQGVGGNGNDIKNDIASLTGWTVKSYYLGGCGYLRDIGGTTFGTLVNNAIAAETDPDTVTDVVIAGSVYNDTASGGTEAQYITAIEQIMAAIKAGLPNARLTIVPTWVGVLDSYNVFTVADNVLAGAQAVGANFPKSSYFWLSIYSDVNSGDNVHPNAKGYSIISEKIVSLLNGADPGVYTGFERVQSVATAGSKNIYVRALGDYIEIRGYLSFGASIDTFYNPFTLPGWAQKAGGLIVFRRTDVNDFSGDLRCQVIAGVPYIGSQAFTANKNYNVFGLLPIVDYNYQT